MIDDYEARHNRTGRAFVLIALFVILTLAALLAGCRMTPDHHARKFVRDAVTEIVSDAVTAAVQGAKESAKDLAKGLEEDLEKTLFEKWLPWLGIGGGTLVTGVLAWIGKNQSRLKKAIHILSANGNAKKEEDA